jgi:hypothetical protein
MSRSFEQAAYMAPRAARGRPAVIMWLRIYASVALVLYVGFAVVGVSVYSTHLHDATVTMADQGTVAALSVLSLLFGGLYAVAAVVPYKPWGWTVALIAICLGLTSLLVFFSVPLLVHWLKPQTKAAFGRL